MTAFPKRALLAIGLPLGALAVFGGSVAFAQSSGGEGSSASPLAQAEPSPTPAPSDTTPTTPTTPGEDPNCPNMDGSGSGDSGTATSQGVSFHRARTAGGSATLH